MDILYPTLMRSCDLQPYWASREEFLFTDEIYKHFGCKPIDDKKWDTFLSSQQPEISRLRDHFIQFCRASIHYKAISEALYKKADQLSQATTPDGGYESCEGIREPSFTSPKCKRVITQVKSEHVNPCDDHKTCRKMAGECMKRAYIMLLWLDLATYENQFDWSAAYKKLQQVSDDNPLQPLTVSVDALYKTTPQLIQTQTPHSTTLLTSEMPDKQESKPKHRKKMRPTPYTYAAATKRKWKVGSYWKTRMPNV